MTDTLVVNEHYLNRVVAVAETAGVEAAEDILTGNGIKLVAKGTRIDAKAKERLLQHKLRKPLESSVRVVDGVASQPLDKVAETLLDKHRLLAGVCGGATARRVTTALRELRLAPSTESMLTVYAAQGPHKLEHAVGVSLLGAAMYHDLPEGGSKGLQTLMMAGLLHDVGELYIDPVILNARSRLTAEQWKHIATHPIVAAHLLRDMPGAGAQVAEAVLHHHERLDGFGYPQGLRGAQLPVSGQVLALAEMLMGLIESGRSPGERAGVAVKLIPGEFNRHLLARVAQAIRMSVTSTAGQERPPTPGDTAALAARVSTLDATLQRMRLVEDSVEERVRTGSPALKELMQHTVERGRRIRLAFSSTGLNTLDPQELRERLSAMEAQVHFEVDIVLREIEWRMHEVKRETRIRMQRLPPADAALVRQFIEESKDAARSALHEVSEPVSENRPAPFLT
ncbi:HD domain-containing protein [Aquabacterium sp. A7-Y]|uniref:HD-GYP domain-containing protein n=1 Tax=Aquabacterium sp. A7-Y TaxID=1349605 RepID=UPI00223CF67A|nr:HD domain-containing phosphohydrolase [Aquabacterium sp. A7-Y]MCW7540136.1 HD domain-containing protein [Aquabacterium sp. A7-Y]